MSVLAHWMGWTDSPDGWRHPDGRYMELNERGERESWNPFTDANADVEVLARARLLWEGLPRRRTGMWEEFTLECPHYSWNYRVGDFARAVLTVLDAVAT